MLQLASNREPLLANTVGPIFPHNLGRGVIFGIFWTLTSRKRMTISRNKKRPSRYKILRSTNWIRCTFSISPTVFEFFFKNRVSKKYVSGWGSLKRLDFVQNTLKIFVLIGNRESPLDSLVGASFPLNWGRGVFWDFPNASNSKMVGDIKMCLVGKLL